MPEYLQSVLTECRHLDDGEMSSGNPELAAADPDTFAVALATVGGSHYGAGDTDTEFSIQSIAKAVAYALAIEDNGLAAVLEAVDVEPSGDSFNEISLEARTGRPRNSLINAGALAVHSMIAGSDGEERAGRLIELLGAMAGRELHIDRSVYEAELESDDRNTAIAHLLKSVGHLGAEPAVVVDGYARQCAVTVTCNDLAVIASVMANGGTDPATGRQVVDPAVNRHVLAVMATCGMYDGSGSWIATVGIPAKSGVAGAIMGVLPGQVGVAVISPRLNEHGNSVRGVAVFERLSRDLGLHMMHVPPSGEIRHSHAERIRRRHHRRTAGRAEVRGCGIRRRPSCGRRPGLRGDSRRFHRSARRRRRCTATPSRGCERTGRRRLPRRRRGSRRADERLPRQLTHLEPDGRCHSLPARIMCQ